jgi:predicted metalloprotease with PDZ domain
MVKRAVILAWVWIFPSSFLAADFNEGSLSYHVSMPQPHTHYFEVEIIVKGMEAAQVVFKMPVWTPGSYLIREYSKNVERFQVLAADGLKALPFSKINKNSWRISTNGHSDFSVRYAVYAFEGSVRMSYLDEDHATIMANTLLLYHDGLRFEPTTIALDIPDQWSGISTALSSVKEKTNTYAAANYDILVDSPIEIGNHQSIEFVAAGVPHEIAMVGHAQFDRSRLVADITSIVESCTAIFGENPNDKYVFIVHNGQKRGGGLEHASSTVLRVKRHCYSNAESYRGFLSLVAHEYFHLWLVKRLKPKELALTNYDEEVYTDLLWVMEGITSYYEEKVMLRSGLQGPDQFMFNIIRPMTNLRNLPGSRIQSVADASFDTWIKFYRKDENSSNSQVSYYAKGMVLGALLDLQIIEGSNGKKSLDDVLRALYEEFYKSNKSGLMAGDFKAEVERSAHVNMDAFFSDYVRGTEILDCGKYLEYAGIDLKAVLARPDSRSLGLEFEESEKGLVITSLIRGGSAYENGLNVGDELIAMDGYRVHARNYNSLLQQFTISDSVDMLVNRDGLILWKKLDVRNDKTIKYVYQPTESISRRQEMVLKKWMEK